MRKRPSIRVDGAGNATGKADTGVAGKPSVAPHTPVLPDAKQTKARLGLSKIATTLRRAIASEQRKKRFPRAEVHVRRDGLKFIADVSKLAPLHGKTWSTSDVDAVIGTLFEPYREPPYNGLSLAVILKKSPAARAGVAPKNDRETDADRGANSSPSSTPAPIRKVAEQIHALSGEHAALVDAEEARKELAGTIARRLRQWVEADKFPDARYRVTTPSEESTRVIVTVSGVAFPVVRPEMYGAVQDLDVLSRQCMTVSANALREKIRDWLRNTDVPMDERFNLSIRIAMSRAERASVLAARDGRKVP